MELGQLTMNEEYDRKEKGISLKASTSQPNEEINDDHSDSDNDDETLNLLV
ncbi:hypothetical protein TanjilG_25778 [Lupinus angustifolius]|uniref:Uncharacterized protein n=1 Tax=Lupinus angustifolius TaxID=3871 RepID=A0A394DCD9_LUPAN|nr:hypothetical protein TanjilG_25778 [Lupinus angustifolius]